MDVVIQVKNKSITNIFEKLNFVTYNLSLKVSAIIQIVLHYEYYKSWNSIICYSNLRTAMALYCSVCSQSEQSAHLNLEQF